MALDGRSDQYGLAVTAYQVLTGWKYPTPDDTAVVYAAKFGHTRMTEPLEHEPRVPRAVSATVMRALSADRDKRFQTSVEFARAVLAGFGPAPQPGVPTSRPLPGPPGPVPPTMRPPQSAVDKAVSRPGGEAARESPVCRRPRTILFRAAALLAAVAGMLCLLTRTENTNLIQDLPVPKAFRLVECHGGYLSLDGLTQLSPAAAEVLASHTGFLSLGGLTNLSDEAAEAIAEHRGRLSLPILRKLTSSPLAARLKRDGALQYLGGLTTLSPDVARILAARRGELHLDGLTTLPTDVAEILGTHEGYLSLPGLTALSDQGAKALAEHKGGVNLNGLTTLSEAGAEMLRANANIALPVKFQKLTSR